MTQDEAKRIEEAAYVILRAVIAAGFGSEFAKGCESHFPPLPADVKRVNLRTARERLTATDAWWKDGA